MTPPTIPKHLIDELFKSTVNVFNAIKAIRMEQEKKQEFNDDKFLNYLIEKKEEFVKKQDFETASNWRLVERLYREYVKKNEGKQTGYFITLEEVVEKYIQSHSSPPTPQSNNDWEIAAFNAEGKILWKDQSGYYYDGMNRWEEKDLLEGDKIYAVRRLSDGLVVSMKDYIQFDFVGRVVQGVIHHFTYCNGIIDVYLCNDISTCYRINSITGQPPGIGDKIHNLSKSKQKNEYYSKRPPLGIMPEWRWKELRWEELCEAMLRYKKENKEVPPEWVSERDELAKVIRRRNQEKIEQDNKYYRISDLISRIFYYGNFKAETQSEKELEKLLTEVGLWPTTEDDILKRNKNMGNFVTDSKKSDETFDKLRNATGDYSWEEKVEQNKERIEVSNLEVLKSTPHGYSFDTSKAIPKEKYETVIAAIQAMLNDETLSEVTKILYEEEINKARKDAFNAARATKVGETSVLSPEEEFRTPLYYTLDDYLKSLTSSSK